MISEDLVTIGIMDPELGWDKGKPLALLSGIINGALGLPFHENLENWEGNYLPGWSGQFQPQGKKVIMKDSG